MGCQGRRREVRDRLGGGRFGGNLFHASTRLWHSSGSLAPRCRGCCNLLRQECVRQFSTHTDDFGATLEELLRRARTHQGAVCEY